jgi:hypothetical protein
MKYSVGDLLLIKDCEYKSRLLLRPHLRPHLRPELFNSYGIITKAIKHSDAWEGESTNSDNVYVWFSQIDGREYTFCENEVTGEVVK